MSLCFSSYVFGWYQDFLPIYIYSIANSYPQHYCKFFLRDYLTKNNIDALLAIKSIYDKFEIIEEYNGVDLTNIKHLQAIRYLIPQEEFRQYDYIYMADIDFILFREFSHDFEGYYLEHCRYTGLPFSNSITQDPDLRLTGLHFIINNDYYPKVQPVIDRVIRGDDYCKSILKDTITFDERMLYYMMNCTFNLNVLDGYTRPHHGIHFGDVRTRPLGHSLSRKNRTVLWNYHRPYLKRILQNKLFFVIYDNMGSEVRNLMDRLLQIIKYPRSFL